MATIRVLGTNYRVATTELTRHEIENAGSLELAQRRGAWDIAEEIVEQIKQMRAQQSINQAKYSLENSLMLGVI